MAGASSIPQAPHAGNGRKCGALGCGFGATLFAGGTPLFGFAHACRQYAIYSRLVIGVRIMMKTITMRPTVTSGNVTHAILAANTVPFIS